MGRSFRGTKMCDIAWLRPDGQEMTEEDWTKGHSKTVGVFLNGCGLTDIDVTGEPLRDDSFYIVFNAHHEPIDFRMPQGLVSKWVPVLNTTQKIPARVKVEKSPGQLLPIESPAPTGAETEPEVLEQTFDDLASLASHICEAPLGCISLNEAGKQWFKVQGEMDEQNRQRDVAFCGEAKLEGDLVTVADATQDERFASNSHVRAEPPIRFFAGTQLLSSSGEMLGTLCVVDHKAHTLSETQREALKTVSRQVISQLELHRRTMPMASESSVEATKTNGNGHENGHEGKAPQSVRVEGRSIAIFRSAEPNGKC